MGVVSDKTTTIDGVTYTTKTFPAAEGLVLLPRIINLFGDNIIELFMKTGEDKGAELMSNPAVLAAMLGTMAAKAEKSVDGWLVLKDVVKYTDADKCRVGAVEGPGNVWTHFDTHFAGRYKHLLEVAFWAAQEGFSEP